MSKENPKLMEKALRAYKEHIGTHRRKELIALELLGFLIGL